VHVLFLTDRLSVRGGADQHLLQVVGSAVAAGDQVTVAFGRSDDTAVLPGTVTTLRVRGLAAQTASGARLSSLAPLLEETDLVHVQNVMNPVALERATTTGRAVVTVQDHRVVCPAMGKTLPDGSRCTAPMSPTACASCLAEPAYRRRMLELTRARRDALAGARLIVLSRYMADELVAAGLERPAILPPWVEADDSAPRPGRGFVLAGRLVRHKAVEHAHRAWRRAATDHPLVVAGAGPLASHLDDAEHLGWLSHTRLLEVLDRARALLFPGWWQEPFGIVGVEALARATPVVVAAGGGTTEWSTAGCVCCRPGDVEQMAEGMRRLAEDDELTTGLGRAGRSMVAERFSRDNLEPQLRELYRQIGGR
jgi:glycosyltransferase involved in cell wall biosynthesis